MCYLFHYIKKEWRQDVSVRLIESKIRSCRYLPGAEVVRLPLQTFLALCFLLFFDKEGDGEFILLQSFFLSVPAIYFYYPLPQAGKNTSRLQLLPRSIPRCAFPLPFSRLLMSQLLCRKYHILLRLQFQQPTAKSQ